MSKTGSKQPSAPKSVARGAMPRKVATKAGAPAATPPADVSAAPLRTPKNLLTAGIKAISSAHEEAVARQSRVFESLLGLGQRGEPGAAVEPAPPTLDPFGFKKFEDVFDQRVARALQHLGVPTAESIADLRTEVERLRETVAKLEAQRKR